MTKIIETRYIFIKKSPKIFDMLEDSQNFSSPLTQYCAKPKKAIPSSAERAKFATKNL